MRFLHMEYGALVAYLEGSAVRLVRHETQLHPIVAGFPLLPWTVKRRPARAPAVATVAEFTDYLTANDAPENGGNEPDSYFHANPPRSDVPVSLRAALEYVEAYGGTDEFILMGYNDGGVFSVARERLPFQTGLDEVMWWKRS